MQTKEIRMSRSNAFRRSFIGCLALFTAVALVGCGGGGGGNITTSIRTSDSSGSTQPSVFAGTYVGSFLVPVRQFQGTVTLVIDSAGNIRGTMHDQTGNRPDVLSGIIDASGNTSLNVGGPIGFYVDKGVLTFRTSDRHLTGNLIESAPAEISSGATVDIDLVKS